jgi:hypothetical protein
MILWIKRIARLMSMLSFFVVFFLSLDPADPFSASIAVIAFIKGCVGALLFWFLGFIAADIVIKGLVTDMHTNKSDTLEGGLLQRLYSMQSSLSPDSRGSKGATGRDGAKTEAAKTRKA